MKTTPKESPEVSEARDLVEYLNSRIKELEDQLQRLRESQLQAQKELSEALVKADEHLPQATLWASSRFSSPKKFGRVVILRQTPKGQLVCRLAGSSNQVEMRFKPPRCEWDDKFYSTEKIDCRGWNKYLLDVPEEYMKAARKQNTQPFS
jgi:hypothetical protein